MRKQASLAIIFITVFIDLLGFGIIIPITPFYIQEFVPNPIYHARALMLLLASYSLMQFIFSPILGRLSDKIGRRPILLISLLGSGLTHIMYAMSSTLWMLYAARILTGIFAATVPTAMAYIADITSTENRAKGMGIIGAAFGLGFIFGPFIGGVLSGHFGYRIPLFAAAGFSLISFLVAYFILAETVTGGNKSHSNFRSTNFKDMVNAITNPQIGILFVIFFAVTVSFANLETIFALFTQQKFGLGARENGYLFAFIGVIGVIVQGLLIGPLSKKFGEKKLINVAVLTLSIGFFLISIPNHLGKFIAIVAMISVSIAIHNPSIISLISKNTPKDSQGSVLGINQSFGSLGRILGPLWGGTFFDTYGPAFPFITAGLLIFLAFLLSFALYKKGLKESTG